MPNQIVPKADDNEGYSWLHIDDFTPGLFTANATGATSASAQTNYTPQPLGSCSVAEGCIGQPNGGLVPLPFYPSTPVEWPYGPIDTDFIFVAGVETNTAYRLNYLMSGDEEETEMIHIVEADDGSTFHLFGVNSYIIETGNIHAVLNSMSASTGTYWGSPYPQWTRINETMDNPYTGDYPVLVFPSIVPTDAQGQNGHMYVYPDVTVPTTFNTEDLIPESPAAGSGAATGQLITYDGRILGLVTPEYDWPDRGDSPQFRSNEVVEYTDPPGSNQYFPTNESFALLVPEDPFGYGTVGSISAGELFLVKRRGGGVLVLGDIDAPSSVTYLPGVQPTGNFFGRGDSTQLGFVYCSQGFGAWVWNGANISQKISTQLEDNFFDVLDEADLHSENYGFFVKRWGDFILFSNGYVYSILTSSWWKLTEPEADEHPYFHYVDARDSHQIYALPLKVDADNETFLYTFDTRVPAPTFEWISTNLYRHLTSISDRRIDVREVVVVASVAIPDPDNGIECVLFSDNNVVGSQVSTTLIGVDPTLIRFNFGAVGLPNLRIKFRSISAAQTPGSSTAAPTIWSFDMAFRARNKQSSDQ